MIQKLSSKPALATAMALLGTASALGADIPASNDNILGTVVVTARNREEVAQDVPLPISVIGGDVLARDNVVTMSDLTQKVPNLLVNAPNARQTSIAIRGLGKNSANDSMEPSVGVIVDNVFSGHVGMSYANYVDIERIEVARGPQGTLLGKNTTLGVVNIVTRQPSFDPERSLEVSLGSRDAYTAKAAASNGIIDGVLAYRASVYADKGGGTLDNQFQTGEQWLEKNRVGGRVQLLIVPNDVLTARIIADHGQSDERINIDPYQVDPATFADGSARATSYSSRFTRNYFDGYRPLLGSRDAIDTNDARPLVTEQNGLSAELNVELGDYTFTSISAYRTLDFDAKNDGDQTRFSISRNGTLLHTEQASQEFRLASSTGGNLDYQVGLYGLRVDTSSTGRTLYGEDSGAFFASNAQYATLSATGIGQALLRDSLKSVFVTTETLPITSSVAAFGQLDWHLTDRWTLTAGVRDTYERKANDIDKRLGVAGRALTAANFPGATAQELAAAQALRNGQVGILYGALPGRTLTENSISWLLSPSYRLSQDVLIYASSAYGAKSGASQFNNSTGEVQTVAPEKASDFELGVKSLLGNGRLLLNANLYQTSVRDYQTNLRSVDPTNTTGFNTILGNIDTVRLRGLEIEGAYTLNRNLSVNFGGAYNEAIYQSFDNAVCAPEVTALICDYSGRQLPNAPRLLFNAGVDHRYTLPNGMALHSYLTQTYRSKMNLNANLSSYGEQGDYTLTNFGIGITGAGGQWELGFVARNAFDTQYATSIGSFSNSAAVGYTLGERRYYGVVLRGSL